MKLKIPGFILFLLLISTFILAQTSDSPLIRIETVDGNEFIGRLLEEDTMKIVLQTSLLGEITIQKKDVKGRGIVKPEQIKEGKLWFDNPQSTRYFWAPNAYGLKKGEGYFQNIYVLWNQFSVGVSDNFLIGGGIIPLFLFDGGPTPIFILPKISIPVKKDKFNIGAGALLGTVIGEDVGAFGLVYGLTTFGPPDKNVSIGMAYGFADGEWANSPLINFSGLFRISSRGYFITENYYINVDGEGGLILGLGGRWMIKKASLDFILAIPIVPDMDAFLAIPAIGFTIPFGNNK